MKSWEVRQFCEPSEIQLVDVPMPEPAEGQVLIRNEAVGVNFFDILQIQGKYQSKPNFPFTVGSEVAGSVEKVGPGVTGVSPGDRVLAFTMSGGYAQYSLAPAKKTFRIPDEMPYPEAAAMPIAYQTSYFALSHRARIQRGEWLLVHAGASGVGMAAIQLGRSFGARIIATAGSKEKLDFCRKSGAEHVINYSDGMWVEQVKQITEGRGADVIFDPVGGDIFDLSSKCVASEGRLLVIGFAGGRIPSIAANRILLKNMSVVGVFWGRYLQDKSSYLADTQAAIFKLYRSGTIHPFVGRLYSFADARAALRDLAERKIIGKAVLVA